MRNKKWYISNKDQVRFRVNRTQHDKIKEAIKVGKRLGGQVIVITPKSFKFTMDNQYIIGREDKAVSLNSLRRRLYKMLMEKGTSQNAQERSV